MMNVVWCGVVCVYMCDAELWYWCGSRVMVEVW